MRPCGNCCTAALCSQRGNVLALAAMGMQNGSRITGAMGLPWQLCAEARCSCRSMPELLCRLHTILRLKDNPDGYVACLQHLIRL